MSTIVLFGTALKSWYSNVPVWKATPLVLLQCMSANNGYDSARDIVKKAEGRTVRLKEEAGGWQLVDTGLVVR